MTHDVVVEVRCLEELRLEKVVPASISDSERKRKGEGTHEAS